MAERDAHLAAAQGKGERGRHALAFFALALAWLAIDQATKRFFETTLELGRVMDGVSLGLVQFRLVHNTGGAWGMFSDATWLLGAVSLAVCAVIAAVALVWVRPPSWWVTLGGALVASGGVGNAIDRFTQGYVVDFFETTFIEFPVFNVADIGVTCGFVILIIGLFKAEQARERAMLSETSSESPEAEQGPAAPRTTDEESSERKDGERA